jgi:hypothetical protein
MRRTSYRAMDAAFCAPCSAKLGSTSYEVMQGREVASGALVASRNVAQCDDALMSAAI